VRAELSIIERRNLIRRIFPFSGVLRRCGAPGFPHLRLMIAGISGRGRMVVGQGGQTAHEIADGPAKDRSVRLSGAI